MKWYLGTRAYNLWRDALGIVEGETSHLLASHIALECRLMSPGQLKTG